MSSSAPHWAICLKMTRKMVFCVKNICCLRKDIIMAKKFCAASECADRPSVTAGYVGAEKGVGRAHYLPPARGFGNMQPSRPQPRWQRSYLHTQCLVLPPSPPSPGGRHKGGRGDLQGWRPAHWHSLISEHTAQPENGAAVGSRSGTPSVSKLPAGCLRQAGIV